MFSRRQLTSATLGAGFLPKALPVFACHAQSGAWKPPDGVRLAGPSHGAASLDPAFARDLDTLFLIRQICRGLVGYDEALNPVPELAGDIQVSNDGLVHTFVLREDARFHDGRPVAAEDVQFSLTRAILPATAGGDLSRLSGTTYLGEIAGADDVMAGMTDELGGVRVIDERTVEITLGAPSSTFLMKLAAMPAAILDRHQDMSQPAWWTALNGSGPYRIAQIDPGTVLSLEAVDSWSGRTTPVRNVTILLGAGAGQPVNLFQGGQIDIVPDVPPALVSLVRDPATGMADAVVMETPEYALAYIALGNQRPPLDDLHVRRALQRVFPADRYAEAAFDGRVRNAEGVIPPGMLGRDWPATLPEVDIDAARAEIAASRYRDAASVPPIRIYAADIAPVEALRDVARDALGLRIEAVQVNWLDFLDGLADRRWDAYSLFWGVDYPDPEALLGVLFGSDSPENYTGYSNVAFDALLAAAHAEPDEETRQGIYAQAQQILVDDAAIIPLYVPIRYTLARAGMTMLPVTAMGVLGLEALS